MQDTEMERPDANIEKEWRWKSTGGVRLSVDILGQAPTPRRACLKVIRVGARPCHTTIIAVSVVHSWLPAWFSMSSVVTLYEESQFLEAIVLRERILPDSEA
jgi:hypothetical protein